MEPAAVITDERRHVMSYHGHQSPVTGRSESGGAERSLGGTMDRSGTKSLGSTIDKGSKSLSSTMDWWNNPESDTLSEHSLADTDRETSPISRALDEEVCRSHAASNDSVEGRTDWGVLQDSSSPLQSPFFGVDAGPSVPDLAISDFDAPECRAIRGVQSLMAASASSLQTERDSWLSGAMSISDIKRLMVKDAKQDEGLANVLAEDLQRSIHAADVKALRDKTFTRDEHTAFLYGSRPQMSVVDFLARIGRYSSASPSCFLVSQIYIDRLKKKAPGIQLNSLTYQRLLLATTMLAAKMNDDHYHSNAVWGKIGGLSTKELNQIELKILGMLDWNICVTWEEFHFQRLVVKQSQIANSPAHVDIFSQKDAPAAARPHHSNPEMRFAPPVQVEQQRPLSFQLPTTASFLHCAPSAGAPLHHISGAPFQQAMLHHAPQPPMPARLGSSGYDDPDMVCSLRPPSASLLSHHHSVVAAPSGFSFAGQSLHVRAAPAAVAFSGMVGQFGGLQLRHF